MSRNRKYVIFSILGAITIILDQWTKILARGQLKPLGYGQKKVVIDGFFDLRYSENSGVAFGMLQNIPAGKYLLTLVAAIALLLVVHYLRRTADDHLRLHFALGLIGGGAIGNLMDRVMYGKVTDFIVWRYQRHEWPAFNVADAALVVGVGLMLLDMLRPPKPSPASNPAAPPGAPSTT